MNNFIKVALHSYIDVHSFLIGWFNYRAMGNVYLSALQKTDKISWLIIIDELFASNCFFFSFSRALIKLIHRPITRATLIDETHLHKQSTVDTC